MFARNFITIMHILDLTYVMYPILQTRIVNENVLVVAYCMG